jgi:membrane protease YdiL (CAAX protease family)
MLETFIQPMVASLNLLDSMQSLGTGWSVVLAQFSSGPGAWEWAKEAAKPFYDVGLFLFAVIGPFVLGKFFSSRLKMPSHAMAFSWILLAIIATGIVLATSRVERI